MKQITNDLDSRRTQNFTYDSLDRLATAQSGATSGADCWGQSYSYDQYSNLTAASVTQCSAPSLSLSINSSTNQITNTGFTYDAAGNVTADNVNSYTWNGAGLMATAAGVTYTYDGGGNRVEKSGGPLYWYGPDGKLLAESDTSGNITSEYIYFGSMRVARRDPSSGNVYYFLGDQLGSARVITDSSGNIQNASDFYPYGVERVITSNITEDHKFTGMERDSETGLDHTDARQYESALGHWLSPDPVAGKARNPQSWNRYTYVIGDPMDLKDPFGMDPCNMADVGFAVFTECDPTCIYNDPSDSSPGPCDTGGGDSDSSGPPAPGAPPPQPPPPLTPAQAQNPEFQYIYAAEMLGFYQAVGILTTLEPVWVDSQGGYGYEVSGSLPGVSGSDFSLTLTSQGQIIALSRLIGTLTKAESTVAAADATSGPWTAGECAHYSHVANVLGAIATGVGIISIFSGGIPVTIAAGAIGVLAGLVDADVEQNCQSVPASQAPATGTSSGSTQTSGP